MGLRQRLPDVVLVVLLLALGLVLYVTLSPPVFPSGIIIKKMCDSVDLKKIPTDEPLALSFELSGKSGGVWTIVADKGRGKVTLLKGKPGNVNLVIYMVAKDFNELMTALGKGKANEYTIQSLIVSDVLSFAGDIRVFGTIFGKNQS